MYLTVVRVSAGQLVGERVECLGGDLHSLQSIAKVVRHANKIAHSLYMYITCP